MKTEGVDYKYDIGDSFIIQVEDFMDDNGAPAYKTTFGALRESDLDTLDRVPANDEIGSVLLLEVRQNDPDYRKIETFDSWLEAYREMFEKVIEGKTSEEIENGMKESLIRFAQYSASVVREEGRFFYYIIKLFDDVEAEG